MPAVEELPTGQPGGQQPHRRLSRRVRKIDFGQLDGLSISADQAFSGNHSIKITTIDGTLTDVTRTVSPLCGTTNPPPDGNAGLISVRLK